MILLKPGDGVVDDDKKSDDNGGGSSLGTGDDKALKPSSKLKLKSILKNTKKKLADYFNFSFRFNKCDENNFTKGRRVRRGIIEQTVNVPRAIIDPGTKQDIIGRVGWHTLEMVEQ